MTKPFPLLLLLFLAIGCTETENPKQVFIPIDGVEIGDQIWMQRNLDIKTFKNGDELFHATDLKDWNDAYLNKIPAWSYYDDLEENGDDFGLIYNYYAIIDQRGLAPEDWKIPSISDYNQLFNFNGGAQAAGIKLKSAEYWINKNGVNESGFNAFPGGERYLGGYFGAKGLVASFWTSSIEKVGILFRWGFQISLKIPKFSSLLQIWE